jgi:GxxExxY protein
MHKDYAKADQWSERVIGAAIEVHRHKGPGLLEEIYEKCLMREFELRGIPAANQILVPLEYKGVTFDQALRLDALVDRCLIVEIKAVEHILPVHKAQLLSYMKLMDVPIGLLINFHVKYLKEGISRMVLRGANLEDSDFIA